MRFAFCTVVMAVLLIGCAGGASKELNTQKYRTVDVHARDGNAMVRNFEEQNGQRWLDHVADYINRCILPGMPEGTKLLTFSGLAGKRTAYLFTMGIVGDSGKVDGFENLYYQVEYQMGNNSVIVLDRGQSSIPGVAAAMGLTFSLSSQLKQGLRPLGGCPA